MSEEAVDLHALDTLLESFKGKKYPVIPILQKAQTLYGYLPKQVILAISEKTGIPLSQLMRSEERRVGQECRSRLPPYH